MEIFEKYQIQILETIIVIALLILINVLIRKWSFRIAKKFHLGTERRQITVRIFNFLILLIGSITIMGIWGLDQKELFVFLTSALTVLGVGFFATWSILSNITAGIILYFNHPVRLGDHIQIIDKDTPIEGTVKDISMFFVHITTIEGIDVTLPNSVVIQKMIATNHVEPQKKTNEKSSHSKSPE